MTSPSKHHFIETVYEMLDELCWGTIAWDGEDEAGFRSLLSCAWDRAARHEEWAEPKDEVKEFAASVQGIVDHYAAHLPNPDEVDEGRPVG